MIGKTVLTYQNLTYATRYTSRPHIPEIAVRFSKMACPDLT